MGEEAIKKLKMTSTMADKKVSLTLERRNTPRPKQDKKNVTAETSEEKKSRLKKNFTKKPRVQRTKNADEPACPMPKYSCFGCGWPGMMKSTSPAYSEKNGWNS